MRDVAQLVFDSVDQAKCAIALRFGLDVEEDGVEFEPVSVRKVRGKGQRPDHQSGYMMTAPGHELWVNCLIEDFTSHGHREVRAWIQEDRNLVPLLETMESIPEYQLALGILD